MVAVIGDEEKVINDDDIIREFEARLHWARMPTAIDCGRLLAENTHAANDIKLDVDCESNQVQFLIRMAVYLLYYNRRH